MTNKKAIYVLLPAALLLWVYIGWQIYQQVKEPEFVETPFIPTLKKETEKEKPSSFVLGLNYKDPFLKTLNGKQATRELEKKKDLKPSNVNRKRMPWPNMTYKGWIENHKKTIGILQINNKQHLVDEGYEYDGIYIEKLYQDSIRIRKNEEEKIIKRQS